MNRTRTAAADLLAMLAARRSVRRFTARPVSSADRRRLLEAATWAPSPTNRQPWRFTLIDDPDRLRELAACVERRWLELATAAASPSVATAIGEYRHNLDWFASAPLLIVFSAKRPDRFLRDLLGEQVEAVAGNHTATAMAAQNLQLAAHALGLGSCCLTGALAAEEDLVHLLGLGRRHRPVCLLAVGHPAERPPPPPRRDAATFCQEEP